MKNTYGKKSFFEFFVFFFKKNVDNQARGVHTLVSLARPQRSGCEVALPVQALSKRNSMSKHCCSLL